MSAGGGLKSQVAAANGILLPSILSFCSLCDCNSGESLPGNDPSSKRKVKYLKASVPELPPLGVKDIPQVSSSYPEAFFQLISSVCEAIRTSKGLIFNSFEELEDCALAKVRKDYGISVFLIGPFHKLSSAPSRNMWSVDRSCISWLNTKVDKSILYVSFGSVVAIDETLFLDIAWALANSKQPFLWVVQPGMVQGSKGTHSLPDQLIDIIDDTGHIVNWAPQQEVLGLPTIGEFWTHCGWNSIVESICKGIPMICLPCFGDQTVNAKYVIDVWKVGLHLEKSPGKGEIEVTIKTLMEEKGQEMRDKITHLREKACICLSEGGSSYNSLECLVSHILSL
ncbi:hypothetical protein Ancab_021620 [Ancistrocladus abbreviatus]